jgi:two-component sensor histidine kinase
MDDVIEAAPVPPERGGDQAEELAYRLRQQQLITEFGCFAFKEHDMDNMLQEASRVSALGLQSEYSKVMEYLPDDDEFIVRAGVGWKPGVVGHARVKGDTASPAGYAFKTAEPIISNHLSQEDRFRTPKLLLDHGVKRAINVIIRSGEHCYGVLEVDSTDGGRFTDADADFLQGFANLLGVALERRNAELSLRRALDDQQMLTQEISHRVKNSLSIVASFLAMQRRISDNSEVQSALLDAEARVQTVAQVHDRLWRNNEVRSIDLAGFMDELCLFLGVSRPNHVLLCDVPHLSIATDRAVPLGLLANELVTNAFKYAYPDGSGEVRLSITSTEPTRMRFEVSDGGIGLPRGEINKSKSLGMRLIENLARQLDGRVTWEDNKPGVRFVMDFPR